ncbi:MAG: lyase family protein, partial [Paracoccaceae bacterium]
MPASALDSAIYGGLLGDGEVAALFSDQAEIRAMLKVEGALALAQGSLGLIPKSSAKAIHSASQSLQIDPQALAADTGRNAVVVPALVAAFRREMNAPEHAQYLHWGATSQDIIDTGLILRLRELLDIVELRLIALSKSLGQLADNHATQPMAGRTWGQTATITSFGAVLAGWGQPMLRHLDRLAELRPRLLCVSLSGAAGTLAVMGAQGAALRAGLARALKLNDAPVSWHTARDNIGELAGWLTLL